MNRITKGLLALGMGSAVVAGARAALTGDVRTYASGNYVLQIDGASLFLKSVEGGVAYAPAQTRGARKDGWADKQNGPVRYSDAVMQLSFGAPNKTWDWVNNFSSPAARALKDVTILGLDYTLAEKSRRLLSGTRISKLELPACDGSSKEPAYLILTLTPSYARETAGTGAKTSMAQSASERMWLPANFTLAIDGLDTSRVSKIDKITIKRGDSGPPEYSDVEVTFAETDAAPWRQWVEATLAGKPVEKNGRLDFLNSARDRPLLRVSFEGLGIVGLSPQKVETNTDTVRRVVAQLYVEKMTFAVP